MSTRHVPMKIAILWVLTAASLVGQDQPRAMNARLVPHWHSSGDSFWYQRELPNGKSEFVVVNAVQGIRHLAFDRSALAKRLVERLNKPFDEDSLPISKIDLSDDGEIIFLNLEGQRWSWRNDTSELFKLETEVADPLANDGLPADLERGRSVRNGAETEIQFENRLNHPVEIYWVDAEGELRGYGQVEANSQRNQHTFAGHRWLVQKPGGELLGVFEATDPPATAIIDGTPPKPRTRTGRSRRRPRPTEVENSDRSPDGKWRALIRDDNLCIVSNDDPNKKSEIIALSQDGSDKQPYTNFSWSRDSRYLVAFRTTRVEIQPVYLLQSSARDSSRATLSKQAYALPGDEFPRYELNVFDITSRTQCKPSVESFEHNWESPRIRWNVANGRFTYLQIDRGHQRLRVIECDPADGSIRNTIDERSQTFIWTMHTEELDLNLVNWLEKSDEIIYASEQSGWRHLYLVNADKPETLVPITSGSWVVRGIQQIDEQKRQVWFSASGVYPDQDPYFLHFGRVDLDGGNLVWLTEGNGQHAVQYSPDRRFLIDTYSRVDQPPIHELRDANTGKKICDIETCDVSGLIASGWKMPEVFIAKGRDNKTDIWGIICRPENFDPKKSYPIIEDIYAGPQSSYVPKSFSPSTRYKDLTDLGFIVVKLDGMGTANRSKAFHDVCWKNLKDAGFEDRIAWIKAAAKKHPEMDIRRVGIYGVSAGGQNAAAAVLFHPEFYKVAVAGCGCHDNRMDKASWNEQWMGYPVGSHYAECSNIDNAYRLDGHLLLIVGELDDNVPPASTLRFADALIRADKDFDLLVVPNEGHGIGGPYGARRMREYFVKHLLR